MDIEKYRAFYLPSVGKYREAFADAEPDKLDQLPAGAILVIQINKDGTRQIVSQKNNLTPKEQVFFDFGLRQLEFKYDGGDTPEMNKVLRENR